MSTRPCAFAAALTLFASACGSAGFHVDHDVVYVDREPPTPKLEILDVPPATGLVWAEGHWLWTGEGFAWVDGRWARPPAPHFVWIAGGWVRHDGRYRFVNGRWAHRDRAPAFAYVHPHGKPDEALSPPPAVAPGAGRSGKCAPTKKAESPRSTRSK